MILLLQVGVNDLNDWVKYSSLGIEMAVIIGAATWGGVVADRHRGGEFPLFTLLLAILGFVVAMVRLLRALKK